MNSKILDRIKERLIVGEKKYKSENVLSDGRNFLKESVEEALDCCVYLAAYLIEIDEKDRHDS